MTLRTKFAFALAAGLIPVAAFAEAFDYLGFDGSKMSPEARDGLNEIYSGRMFYAAIPVALKDAMSAEDAKRIDELGYDPASPEGMFYATGQVPSPPNRNTEDLALSETLFERDDTLVTNGNCFGCHSGVVNGQVVAGLGNNAVMQRTPKPDDYKGPNMFKFASLIKTDGEKKAMQTIMEMSKGVNSPVPPVTSRGDNYGPFAVWAHGAMLEDPANKGMIVSYEKNELTDLIENNMAPPVDPMPWWLMKYKERDYWYSDGAPDDGAHFSFNFSSSNEVANDIHESHVESTSKALAFARETQSPIYPGQLDAELVKKGADIFHGRVEPVEAANFKACFECHGTYTKKSATADFSKPGGWHVAYEGDAELRNVSTDNEYNKIVQALRPISEHITGLDEFYKAQERPDLTPVFDHLEGKGYVPPPLVGVWATAPYFHNGSVPTVEAVLNSKLRPAIWKREISPFEYDLERMGLEFEPLTRVEYDSSVAVTASAPYQSKESLDTMFLYDTEAFGRGNMGHTFGDKLTDSERASVMEFLKSLSGSDM